MISGGELRKGIIIELDGELYQVIDYQHIKMKRTALAKVKLRDILAGHTIEPGIYLAGWGGVRIEDLAIMENGEIRVISKARK